MGFGSWVPQVETSGYHDGAHPGLNSRRHQMFRSGKVKTYPLSNRVLPVASTGVAVLLAGPSLQPPRFV